MVIPAGPAQAAATPSAYSFLNPYTYIAPGGSTNLFFALTNNDTSTDLTNVGFTATLPANITGSNVSWVSDTECIGGSANYNTSNHVLTLSGAKLVKGTQCNLIITVSSSVVGSYSFSGTMTSSQTSSANSDTAVLLVGNPPTVTTNPSNQIVNAGQTASFSAAVTGDLNPTAQWQVSTNGGSSFTNISGATSTTYSFTTAAGDSGKQYRAVFTGAGKATTTAATLTVNVPPAITTNPSDQSVSSSTSVTFTAAATGTPTPTVQWQVSTDGGSNYSAVSGATSTTLTFVATGADNGKKFRAAFSNAGGTTNTTAATLTINLIAQSITFNPPSSRNFVAAQTIPLSATGGASGNPVTFSSNTTSICTTGGTNGATITVQTAGTCSITASQAGNSTYATAANVTKTFDINQLAQTISFTQPDPVTFSANGTVALQATGGASGNTVTFAPGDTSICTISGSTVTLKSAGNCVITASQAGNVNYTTASNVAKTLVINQATQTIDFTQPDPVTYSANGTVSLQATGGASGNAVTFAPGDTSICTISGSTVTIKAVGNCVITASQAGNGNYLDAPTVAKTLVINQASQTISFTQPDPATYSPNGTVSLTATGGSSGSAITFTPGDTSICTISGSTVTIKAVGNCVITASQSGNANYLDAQTVEKTLVINQASQTISFTQPDPATFTPNGTVTLSATGGDSGNAVTFAPGNTSICTISGSTVTLKSAGNCVITASQSGNGNYLDALSVEKTLVINQASQTISFTQPDAQTYAPDGTFTLEATGGNSGNAVTFASGDESICTVSGSTVTIKAVGNCVITASQSGNTSYQDAQAVEKTIVINQASQVINFTQPDPKPYSPNGTVTLVATGGSSGNPVTFASGDTSICTVTGSTVTIKAVGNCDITASQEGDGNYAAAQAVTKTLVIGKAAQTISFTSTPPSPAQINGTPYQVAATGGNSGNQVTFSIDASSSSVCSIAGNVVSFLATGSCLINANQNGDGNYAPALQVQQSITVINSIVPSTHAIGGFISDRANLIVSNLFDMDRGIDRLNEAQGQNGSGSSGFSDDPAQAQPLASAFGPRTSNTAASVLPALNAMESGTRAQGDLHGLQAMLARAMGNAADTGTMDRFNYSGAFDASLNFHDGFAGSFHTSLSQITKFERSLQQKEAASLGLNLSGRGSSYSPLDVWAEGTYAGYDGERAGQFGLFSVGSDYVFNPNLLAGFFAQVDTMNQTTGTTVNGTGWMAGPYATMRMSDNLFWNGRAAFGRSGNTLSGSGDFTSTRLLASTSLIGHWQLTPQLRFSPDLSFTYFQDRTDTYQDVFNVTIPSVTTELGQLKLSPKLVYGFATDGDYWVEPSLTPELIWNFASTNIDGLGALADTATGPTGLRGKLKAGLALKTPGGTSIGASASYDGIGATGYSSVSGQVQVNVPLQ